MINVLMEMLKTTDNKSECIQILKGKYEIPMTLKQGLKQSKDRK